MNNVKTIVCYGENKNRIKDFGDNLKIETVVVDTVTEAVDEAYNLSNEGDIILLSPASASWDQYKCFEDRGIEYKNHVLNLGE
jgi:UDP-N-acetylmuramoylalanine--D-glutamate ligase